jgi:hypothetical protein
MRADPADVGPEATPAGASESSDRRALEGGQRAEPLDDLAERRDGDPLGLESFGKR